MNNIVPQNINFFTFLLTQCLKCSYDEKKTNTPKIICFIKGIILQLQLAASTLLLIQTLSVSYQLLYDFSKIYEEELSAFFQPFYVLANTGN